MLQLPATAGGGEIALSARHDLTGGVATGEWLPFFYQFVPGNQSRPQALLILVAAPGVEILDAQGLIGRPASLGMTQIHVVRVQDAGLIPALGSDVTIAGLLARNDINRPRGWNDETAAKLATDDVLRLGIPTNYLTVERNPDGITIGYPLTGQIVVVRVPVTVGMNPPPRFGPAVRTVASSAEARFAYEILADGDVDDPGTRLRIVKTSDVEVSVQRRRSLSSNPSLPRYDIGRPAPPPRFWKVWNVESLTEVPPQGSPITPGPLWRWRPAPVSGEETSSEALHRSAIDIAIGFIPVVGDLVDLAELSLATMTGVDRWGRAVTQADVTLMTLGAMMPFITSPMLRTPQRIARVFGEHGTEVARTIEQVAKALNPDEVKLIREMDALVKAGGLPSAGMWERYSAAVRRIGGKPPTLGEVLNSARDGFLHAELQEAYQVYRQKTLARGGQPADAADWARLTREGSRDLLEKVLGRDFVRAARAPDVPVRLANIPETVRYADAATLAAAVERARGSKRALWSRLDKFIAELEQAAAAGQKATIGRGRFGIFKGNLAEVLSADIQLGILRDIARRTTDAVLIRGVKVRRLVDGQVLEQLFSDNIIATIKDGQLTVLAVIEVKAGSRGDEDVTLQMFEWIEARLEDGSQVVLPVGTELVNANGVMRTLGQEQVFTWRPPVPDAPTVVNLVAADRHRITAAGVAVEGIVSEYGIAAKVVAHPLQESSRDLDYLARTLLDLAGVG